MVVPAVSLFSRNINTHSHTHTISNKGSNGVDDIFLPFQYENTAPQYYKDCSDMYNTKPDPSFIETYLVYEFFLSSYHTFTDIVFL